MTSYHMAYVLDSIAPKLVGLTGQEMIEVFKSQGVQLSFRSSVSPFISEARGGLILRHGEARALWHKKELHLTVSEFRIVDLISSSPGHNFSYRGIYDMVHGEGFVAGGDQGFHTNVRSIMKRMRNKFKEADPNFDQIENARAFGYCWKS